MTYHFFVLFYWRITDPYRCRLKSWKISLIFINTSSQYSYWCIGHQSATAKSLLNISPEKNFKFVQKNIYLRSSLSFLIYSDKIWCCSQPQWAVNKLSILQFDFFSHEAVIDKQLITFADASGIVYFCWNKCQTRCKVIK